MAKAPSAWTKAYPDSTFRVITPLRICVVRDFKALHYQIATLFIKCFKV